MSDYYTYLRAAEAGARSSVMSGMLGAGAHFDSAIADRELAAASHRVDRLLLVVDALWELLQEHGFSDEDLRRRLLQLEAAIETAPTGSPARCRACDSVLDPSRTSCVICGEKIPGPDPAAPPTQG